MQEAGRKGHTIVSTLHANSARSALRPHHDHVPGSRTSLSRNDCCAISLKRSDHAFQTQLPDKSRKYMRFLKPPACRTAKSPAPPFTAMRLTTMNMTNPEELPKYGNHQRLGNISPALAVKALGGGVPQKEIRRFAEGAEGRLPMNSIQSIPYAGVFSRKPGPVPVVQAEPICGGAEPSEKAPPPSAGAKLKTADGLPSACRPCFGRPAARERNSS